MNFIPLLVLRAGKMGLPTCGTSKGMKFTGAVLKERDDSLGRFARQEQAANDWKFLVPKLRLGTQDGEAPLRVWAVFGVMPTKQKLSQHAFPSGAWEPERGQRLENPYLKAR